MDKNKKKVTDDYMSGLSGAVDSFIKSPTEKKLDKTAKFDLSDKGTLKEETKKSEEVKTPKAVEKPEPPKVVVPKFIKKDSDLEKAARKLIQEVPKEEIDRLINPTAESKEKLLKMDFSSRNEMSEEEKRDFIEQIAKREPEPEVAQMNGAFVYNWQKNRRMQAKKEIRKDQ